MIRAIGLLGFGAPRPHVNICEQTVACVARGRNLKKSQVLSGFVWFLSHVSQVC
jgi:hypothetical protein